MGQPLLIGIGASHSGSGKTYLACRILRHLTGSTPSASPIPSFRCGAIKSTRTVSGFELVTDIDLLMEKGKDTWHMLRAGAERVMWVKSDRAGLPKVLPPAYKRLSDLDIVFVEGNSAIEFLKPDIVIFIFGKGKKHWKPGIMKLAVRADIILSESGLQLPADINPQELFPSELSGRRFRKFIDTLIRMVNERKT